MTLWLWVASQDSTTSSLGFKDVLPLFLIAGGLAVIGGIATYRVFKRQSVWTAPRNPSQEKAGVRSNEPEGGQ